MRRFAQLYQALDQSNATGDKLAALVEYFRSAPPADAAWAVAFLVGRRPRRVISAPLLRTWAAEEAGVSEWLFEECYQQVGDLGETIALLLPPHGTGALEAPLAEWVEQRLLALPRMPVAEQRELLVSTWRALDANERFVWNKLLTGGFRVGVSARLVIRALATASGLAEELVAHRITGKWEPSAEWYARLVSPEPGDAIASQPYPFFLAYPLEAELETLGAVGDWQVEWKWDGIRAQLVRRAGDVWLWSRGEELLAGRFPELEDVARLLPDGTVLDGEILPWRDGAALPFALLQKRITRKTVTAKLREEVPVVLLAFDLLEQDGQDLRTVPLAERRARLEALLAARSGNGRLLPAPIVTGPDWAALTATRADARRLHAEGYMLKRRDSAYGVGRRKGDWWKWKVDPYSVDAVLLYAQPGHGRRAGLYTDYTFAVRHGDEFVPFAKAYSGLSDEEIRQVDAFVRANTLDRFGPVRSVKPELVFEIAFEGIQASPRHKSGIAVRFPRMARWRHDKTVAEADTLDALHALLRQHGGQA